MRTIQVALIQAWGEVIKWQLIWKPKWFIWLEGGTASWTFLISGRSVLSLDAGAVCPATQSKMVGRQQGLVTKCAWMERRSWYIPWEDTLTRAQEMHLLLRCYFECAYYICNCHNLVFSLYSSLLETCIGALTYVIFFPFEFSTYYLASVGSEWVRYWVEHGKINSVSPSNRVLFCFFIQTPY